MRGVTWGGRFGSGPDPEMLELTASLDVDLELLPYDAAATRAHARVLAAAGLLDEAEVRAVDAALAELVRQWEDGELVVEGAEDVHSLVERELTVRLGDTGRRIHAGRSRNDLVVTDFRMWCGDAAAALDAALRDLVEVLAGLAEEHADTVMPGFTHLQAAQPVTIGYLWAAHAWPLVRDLGRVAAARAAADVCALGAGALAGTTLQLDFDLARAELGFARACDNALDAVSERDFACDLLYACALVGVHLSRLGEDLVVLSSPGYGFLRLPEAWSTGSSMMPNKRNPDMAELVRGRAAVTCGELAGLLALLKGLPSGYDRDLQEDKAPVFRAVARTLGALRGCAGMLRGVEVDRAAAAAAAARSDAWATDVAELLVTRGVPFRTAHEVAGRLVARAARAGGLTGELLEEAHEALQADDLKLLEPSASVARRRAPWGPAPDSVRAQARALRAASAR